MVKEIDRDYLYEIVSILLGEPRQSWLDCVSEYANMGFRFPN